jgi:LuxR family transcriptional regulator, maltose regulon positive regulatory protein
LPPSAATVTRIPDHGRRRVAPAAAPIEPAALPFDVVEPKIRVPALRSGTVSRTALVNRLRANTAHPVVTVTAPAGYGKTTLLAQWAVRERRPVAWISVDERDDDPVVLLRHVAAALHSVAPLKPDVLEPLVRPGSSPWTSIIPSLGAALAAFDDPVALVLDDADVLRSQDSLDSVGALIEHLPDGSALVLAGRSEPRLPIATIRADGSLLELGADDLALTPREAHLLLRATGAGLELEEMRELVRHCEGWPAALSLAALSTSPASTGRSATTCVRSTSSGCVPRLAASSGGRPC